MAQMQEEFLDIDHTRNTAARHTITLRELPSGVGARFDLQGTGGFDDFTGIPAATGARLSSPMLFSDRIRLL